MRIALLLALVSMTANVSAQQRWLPVETDKLHGDLERVLDEASTDALLPITIVLAEQAPATELRAAAALSNKAERRARVTTTLKDVAQRTQAPLLQYLAEREAAGEARGPFRRLWVHNVIGAEVTASVARAIAARADVTYIHHDPKRGEEVLAAPARAPVAALSPAGGTPTCGIVQIGADQVWSQLGITGQGVVVGVIDTGSCLSHPDIQNQLWHNPCEIDGNGIDDDQNGFIDDIVGWNFQNNNKNVNDNNGHGSHTSGTVGGDGTSGTQTGVAPGVDVMVLKFWNDFAGEQTVWDSMQYALDNGADVVSASLGWPHAVLPDRATWRAISENLIAAGVVVVFASGNEGCSNEPDDVRTPGDVPDVITAGAVNCNDSFASFSSCGPITWQDVPQYGDHPYPPGLIKPTVAADGVNTISLNLCNGYTTGSGTSMSTPHIAGVAALLLQADPGLDQLGVKAILESTAVDLGSPGKDNSSGSGRIDAFAAVQAALSNGNYCAPKLNSCGVAPTITTVGASSASQDFGFWVVASNMRAGHVGLMVYSDVGADVLPLLGGSLCVQSFHRTVPVIDTVGTPGLCNGELSLDMNAFAAGLLGGTAPLPSLSVPGTSVWCQFWGRDPGNSFGALLTGSVKFVVCP